MVELPQVLVQQIVVYLSTKPFREVAQLIMEIQKAVENGKLRPTTE